MKICLILGAYNPGQCGISDYVELLSEEFKKEGHAVKILSVDLKQKKYSFGDEYRKYYYRAFEGPRSNSLQENIAAIKRQIF